MICERANEVESNTPRERATDSDRAKGKMSEPLPDESTTLEEREASIGDSTFGAERAKVVESTITNERAAMSERAKLQERSQ
jgi:hypothetical protein